VAPGRPSSMDACQNGQSGCGELHRQPGLESTYGPPPPASFLQICVYYSSQQVLMGAQLRQTLHPQKYFWRRSRPIQAGRLWC